MNGKKYMKVTKCIGTQEMSTTNTTSIRHIV